MFSKKRVLPFKSYFYFPPRLFSFADSKFFLFHFNAHKSKYINEGVKVKLAFSSKKHNFLTTPPPSLYNNSFVSLLLNLLFHPRSQGSLLPTSTERAKERERERPWLGLVTSPPAKLILREKFFVSQFFVCFSFCHHTIDPSFRFHRSQSTLSKTDTFGTGTSVHLREMSVL